MKTEDFQKILDATLTSCQAVLGTKAAEYADDADRLHNFKRAAALLGKTPITALQGMLTKHIVSIYDMMDGIEAGKKYDAKIWDEKIGDSINYLILLKAAVAESDTH